MALSTTHSLTWFDATLGILYVKVQIVDGSTVMETVNDLPVRLTPDISGNVPVGAALEAVVATHVQSAFSPQILAERERSYAVSSGISNTAAIQALTTGQEPEEAATPYLVGYVYDTTGAALSGATVVVGVDSTTTDANGYYLLAVSAGTTSITAYDASHLGAIKVVDVIGMTHVDFTLLSTMGYTSVQTITGTDVGDNTVINTGRLDVYQAEIDFTAGAIVDGSGNPVADVSVEMTNLVVSDAAALTTFPGTFLGDNSGTTAPIASYGYIQVKLFEDGTNNELTLDPDIGATVRLPVDPDPVGVNTIDTWRLNEATGIWEYTGFATRLDGTNVFEFQVTSFSWHNLDYALPSTVNLTVTAYNDSGFGEIGGVGTTPEAGVEITVDILEAAYDGNALWQGRGTTDINGQLTLQVPAGFLRVSGKKGVNVYNGYAYDIDDITGDATINLFYFLPPLDPPVPEGQVLGILSPNTTYDEPTDTLILTGAAAVLEGMTVTIPGVEETFIVAAVDGTTITLNASVTLSRSTTPWFSEIIFLLG